MNNTNITYNNSIAITTYTNNIANDTDITYNTIILTINITVTYPYTNCDISL